MNFTSSQQNAIDVRDCSLIISAGAGSGKTAVLTERILERICDEEDECNIDDFLIVTFTNAAAKELYDRIRKKLCERAEKEPENKKIIKNLARLPLARISTINSFCYELTRLNFQKIGLGATVRIADDTEISVIREKLINEVIDDYFEEHGDDEEFLAAYEVFSSAKDDGGFVNTLTELDRRLRNLPDRQKFCTCVLDEYRDVYENDKFFETIIGKRFCENTKKTAEQLEKTIDSLIELCSQYEVLTNCYIPALDSDRDFIRSILDACDKDYVSVKNCADGYKSMSLKAARNFDHPEIADIVKTCKSKIAGVIKDDICANYACSETELKKLSKDTGMIIEKLFEILDVFDKRLDERKKELSIIEFSDAERYALELLVEKVEPFTVTSLAKQLQNEYKEIYIDEYQDVNPLQDMIFRALSKQDCVGNEYTRFMVGDIKQSIYRFRGASSEIFMSYRDTFSDIDEKSSRKRIFMSDNFRCAESVIKLTNMIFKKLMSEYYDDKDSLNFARHERIKVGYKAKLCAFSYDKNISEGYSTSELEAAFICKKIKEMVNNPKVTDSEGRMYSYRDIGILTRNNSALKTYEMILSNQGIPVLSNVGESFYGKKEIILCLNILNAVDNPQRDIYLAGFMRSFAGGFTDDELAIIKHKSRKMSLYRALTDYAENEHENDDELSNKCRMFAERLYGLRSFSRGKTADKLVWKIFGEFDLLNLCCSDSFTHDKKGARKNLLKLYQIAREFSKTSFRGVGAFIDYINSSMKKSDMKAERELGGDCVSLMTIHASKGLEFPICFVSDLARRFNKSDERSRLVFSEKAGVATTICDTASIESVDSGTGLVNIDTPFRALVGSSMDRDIIAEEIRVLYVALTRARDVLIMTGAFPKIVKNTMKDALTASFTGDYTEFGNYMSILLASLAEETALSVYYDIGETGYVPKSETARDFLECEYLDCKEALDILESFDENEVEESRITCGETDDDLLKKLKNLGNVKLDMCSNPSKITVSQLKKGLIDEELLAKSENNVIDFEQDESEPVPSFLLEKGGFDGAEAGTAMHLFMQFCDFDGCETDGCTQEAERLFAMGFISEHQKDILDTKKLDAFFASDFYRSIKVSKNIYREQRFNLDVEAFDAGITGDVLVQGVIDLFYENEDGTYTVVDFKTDRVYGAGAESTLIDRHKSQILYYKRAVEDMTGCEVKNTYIYSFSLMKPISVE